jgi:hypothetical protein
LPALSLKSAYRKIKNETLLPGTDFKITKAEGISFWD